MKKKICILLSLLMIMICLIIIFNNNEANAEDGLNLKLNDKCEDLPYSYLENQNEASAITDKFIKSLVEKNGISVDDSEYTVNGMRANAYPLYYAGAYINTDGNLVLQISEDYYKEDYKDCEWYTEFTNIVNSENFYSHPARHSYSELVNAISDITKGNLHKRIIEEGLSITGAGINDYKNIIDVYVKNLEDYDRIVAILDSEWYYVEVLDCVMQDCVGLYPGGGATTYNTGDCEFSVACRARKNLPDGSYVDGFLTCAHSFSGTSDVYIDIGATYNIPIGTCYSYWQKKTSTSDVAFIETNNNTTLYDTVFMDVTILNPSYSATMGTVVYKRGTSTGTTHGEVIYSSYSGTDVNGETFNDLVWAGAGTFFYDSGGIVYSVPDATGHANVLGIIKATIYGSLVFTKMYNDLGALQSGPIYFSLY